MSIDSKVKKNFGFGCMRLPMVNGEVDKAEFCRMIDTFPTPVFLKVGICNKKVLAL